MKGTVILELSDYEKLIKSPGFKMVELSELRAMRAKLSLSMDQVEKKTGISKATISRIELERNCIYQNVKVLYELYINLIE